MFKKLPQSTRKFIRSEKARIRSQFLDIKKQEEQIVDLYKRISGDASVEVKTEAKVEKSKKIEVKKDKTKRIKAKKK